MVAQTDSLDSKDRATLKTDRLFSQSGPPSTPTIERNISVAPPALDEGVQAAGLENPEGIQSSEIIQNTALETPGHPSAELPNATDKPPTTNFAKPTEEDDASRFGRVEDLDDSNSCEKSQDAALNVEAMQGLDDRNAKNRNAKTIIRRNCTRNGQ